MKFQLETPEHNLISQYGPGQISINGVDYTSNVLVSRQEVVENWFDGDLDTLELAHFEPLLSLDGENRPEIVVFGSGSDHRFPNLRLLADLKAHGMALEVMSTRAACRTYSVLVNEYRPVAAALLQIV